MGVDGTVTMTAATKAKLRKNSNNNNNINTRGKRGPRLTRNFEKPRWKPDVPISTQESAAVTTTAAVDGYSADDIISDGTEEDNDGNDWNGVIEERRDTVIMT